MRARSDLHLAKWNKTGQGPFCFIAASCGGPLRSETDVEPTVNSRAGKVLHGASLDAEVPDGLVVGKAEMMEAASSRVSVPAVRL